MALTTEQLKALQVGQTLYFVGKRASKYNTTVTKIGKKYFYTDDGERWYLDTGGTGSEFSSGELYINEQSHKEETERVKKWAELRDVIMRNYYPPSHLTITDIQEIINKLKI